MKLFFSVDWGSSSLRVRLIKLEDQGIKILYEYSDHNGIAYVFSLWQYEVHKVSREAYFLSFLQPHFAQCNKYFSSEKEAPLVIISGMASSTIGIKEVVYSPVPFDLNRNNLNYALISKSNDFNYDVLLLSGLSSQDDVMRGEEVQLLGLQKYHNNSAKSIFIFPGTHSKHVFIKNKQVTSFKTYITGEMFKLLSEYSVLKNSLKRADQLDKYSFNLGVNQSKDNILNRAFSIRAMSILSKQKNICNYSFLSGLLIGSELNDLKYTNVPIYLCAHKNLSANYALAMEQLSLGERCTVIQPQVVDNSVIHGQILFFKSVFC